MKMYFKYISHIWVSMHINAQQMGKQLIEDLTRPGIEQAIPCTGLITRSFIICFDKIEHSPKYFLVFCCNVHLVLFYNADFPAIESFRARWALSFSAKNHT